MVGRSLSLAQPTFPCLPELSRSMTRWAAHRPCHSDLGLMSLASTSPSIYPFRGDMSTCVNLRQLIFQTTPAVPQKPASGHVIGPGYTSEVRDAASSSCNWPQSRSGLAGENRHGQTTSTRPQVTMSHCCRACVVIGSQVRSSQACSAGMADGSAVTVAVAVAVNADGRPVRRHGHHLIFGNRNG